MSSAPKKSVAPKKSAAKAAPATPPKFKTGLAVLVGRTNVGKSTLLNALVGSKISIVTPRPQTTREPVQGVVHRPEGQIVLVDTPGFFKTHTSPLVDKLHERARKALEGIDVVIHVVDPARAIGEEDEMVLAALSKIKQPRILCLNKADLRHRPFVKEWRTRGTGYTEVVEISALLKKDIHKLVDALLRRLPAGEALYEKHQKSNATKEFLVIEMIREQIYLLTGQEVPYRTAVELDSFGEIPDKDGTPMVHIKAAIVTPNDRYQRMLIGIGARKIKQIGIAARGELERHFSQKVFLEMDVIVDKKMLH